MIYVWKDAQMDKQLMDDKQNRYIADTIAHTYIDIVARQIF